MRRLALLNVKTNYKTTTNMTIWHWHKNRELEKWYKIKSSDTNSLICGPFNILFQSDSKIIAFSIKVAEKLPIWKKNEA